MDEVVKSLRSIVKGTVLASVGMFSALLFSFLQRWTIIRTTTPEEYGLYSLSLAVIAIFLSIGGLGLHDGIARTVSFHAARESPEEYKRKIFSSLLFLAALSGGACIFFLVMGSSHISAFFGKDIAWIIQIIAVSLPFTLLLDFLISFFRGIEKAEIKVIFNDITKNVIFFSLLVVIFLKTMGVHSIVLAYVTSIMVSSVLIMLYALKKVGIPQVGGTFPVARELLLFSLPLLGGSLFQLITAWADTLLLGVFRTSEEIALYNAALPTSRLIQMFLGALVFIYIPVATSLFSKGLSQEMKRVYAVVSKWVVSLTFPLFLVLFLNADTLFLFLYGTEYVLAVVPFRILTIGYLLQTSFGPNGGALIAMGKTKLVMGIICVIAMTNLGSNMVFIPRMGMVGAALSMVVTLVAASSLRGIAVYKIAGIHPFRWNYAKPVISSVLVIYTVQTMLDRFVCIEAWMLPFLLVGYTALYAGCMVLTRSVDKEDFWMLLILEQRIGLNLTQLERIIQKFMR